MSFATAPASHDITILGDGAMATVCSILLTHNGHRVTLWGRNVSRLIPDRTQHRLLPGVKVPDEVRLIADEAQALRGATMVVSAIPTQYMRSVWGRCGPKLADGVPVISVAKGVENETLLRPTQILEEAIKTSGKANHPLAALSGPNIAAELARQLPGTAVAASEDESLARTVQAAFSTPWFRVYTNTDVLGVELAGAMKNIIAIAAGILDGMKAGNNAKAALVTRGLVEISRLGTALGARPETFQGLAGLGDLITTCVAPEGRNRQVGQRIGEGATLEQVLAGMASVAEGVPTTRSVVALAKQRGIDMPITETLHAILFEGKSVRTGLMELMTREAKAEN